MNNSKTHPTIDPNTNRFNSGQGIFYDKNGNIIQDVGDQDAVRTFVFNGENKQRFVVQAGKTIGEYFYDGEGQRVKKVVYEPNTTTVKEETVFVYSSGKLVEEYSTKTPPSNPTTSYTATDQLGSPRVITDSNGNVVSRRDFMPFGEEITNNIGERDPNNTSLKYGVADGIRQKFTGYQKDDETGLDFAEARMYENRHGRFTAVDPLLASGKSGNPQTFNRYVYVMNSPLAFTDPSGLQAGSNICPPQCPSLNIDPNYNGPPGIITTIDVDGGGNQSLLDLQEDYATTLSNSVLSQPTLSAPPDVNYTIRALLGGFPESPFLEAGKGLIKGPPNFVIDTTNFITQKGGYAPNRLAIQRFGCSSSIECNWSTASTLTTGLVGGVVGGVFRGASSLSVVSESNFARTALTNEQIIQKSATIAERRIGGTGAVPGTLKHTYSQRLINRYQSIYGDRGLVTERSWLNGSRANYGTRGSSRLDVLDTTTMNVYDFKFTIRPPALTTRQINQIRVNGPAGIRGIFEINP